MALSLKAKVILIAAIFKVVASQVVELDDMFLENRGDKPWLVEFYAPWCGHCRKLEPIYHQVSLALKSTPIRVAKIDATRFTHVAAEFGVRGYPTIKFIQAEQDFTHRGDRSKEGIIEFAKRAQGPQVRPLSNLGKFNDARSEHSDGVFFLFVGAQDAFGDLLSKYTSIAEKYAVLAYFYAGEPKILPGNITPKNDPTVLVFKDGQHFEYETPEGGPTKGSLDTWVNGERYSIFPKINGGALNEMSDMTKRIVMVITDEKDRKNTRNERFKEMTKHVATGHRDKYHKDFQFMWQGDSESANSIVMGELELPSIIVLEPETQYYYTPDSTIENFKMSEMTQNDLTTFLDHVVEGKSPPYGGNSFLQRVKRVFYDIWMTIYEIYKTSGWLALIVFGVPSIVISIVCYALCCMEPIDDSIFEGGWQEEQEALAAAEDAEKAALLEGEKKEEDIPDDGHMKKE